MSILKNLFAAVGAVTLGAVAVGVVLGATTAMTADDEDGEKKASDTADTDAGKAEEEPAEKVEEKPAEKAEGPETPAEAEEDKAEKQ